MIDYFARGLDIYTESAYAYHVGFKKKDWDKAYVRKVFRNAYKLGVISSIYTASDPTLSVSFEVEVHEVREIRNAIFKQFQTLYDWQQAQIAWNKANRNRIRTFLGDIRKTYEEAAKQTRQAVFKFAA